MKKFQKNVEDFVCDKCGTEVKGGGYTNHCPKCLYSKHVDVNPGDRLSPCLGVMEPVSVESRGGEYTITHKCISCGHMKKNKADSDDNFDAILAIARGNAKEERFKKI